MNNKAKNSQRYYFAWENLPGSFCCIFILLLMFLISFLIFICRFSSFTFCFSTSSLTLPWTIAGVFTPHFIFSAQPIAEWFATLSFSTIPLPSYRERYGFEWALFTHRRFLPYTPSPTFFTQPALIKASLRASSSSLKFVGLHTYPRNTDPAHLPTPNWGRFYLRVRAG